MLTILVLFVGLTLATAVIAYWSDNLGKKLGKKRVSLWGMRPRTTATFLTIASSWLIMIFTLGVMLTLFPLLRQSLLYYDEARANEKTLKISATKLTGQVDNLGGKVQALQENFSRASDDLSAVGAKLTQSRQAATAARKEQNAAEKEAAAARKSANDSRAREKSAEARAKKARQNLQSVTKERNATQQQRDAAQRELNSAQTELGRANAKVEAAAARVTVANARVTNAQSKAAQAEGQFERAQIQLDKVRKSLSTAQANEKTANRSAADSQRLAEDAKQRAVDAGARAILIGRQAIESGRKVVDAEAKLAALSAQSEQLQSDNAKLILDNQKITEERRKFRQTANILSQGNVRVPVDSTLVEHSFERATSAQDVRRELRAMFTRSADFVVPGLLDDAELKFADFDSLDGKRSLTPDEVYDNLVNFIAGNPEALSVRLVAARNHLVGESVLESKFLVLPIRPALSNDFELARVELDGRSGQGPLFSALLDLVDEGIAVAKSRGIAPPLSPDVPNFYVPGSREQIFDTLREIKTINGPVRVRIITTQPISTADQLSVKFAVEPIGASATQTQANARLAPPRK